MSTDNREPESGTSLLVARPARPALLLYLLLFISAVLTGIRPVFEQAVREGRWPRSILMVAPAMFALFIALFAIYRFALVRAGHYHAGKAFVQVGFMVLVLALLLPGSLERYRAMDSVRPVELSHQLDSPDPEVRAVAAELTRHRSRRDVLRYLPRLIELIDDPSAEVRRQARASLVSIAGKDEGGEGNGAAARWRTYWQSQGISFPDR